MFCSLLIPLFDSALGIGLIGYCRSDTTTLGNVPGFAGRNYGIDILAATAILSAVLFGQYWAAIVVAIMLTGGEALEDYAEHRAKTELNILLDRAPKQAHLFKKNQLIDVSVAQIRTGDQLIYGPVKSYRWTLGLSKVHQALMNRV